MHELATLAVWFFLGVLALWIVMKIVQWSMKFGEWAMKQLEDDEEHR